jgi:hypothetical protein
MASYDYEFDNFFIEFIKDQSSYARFFVAQAFPVGSLGQNLRFTSPRQANKDKGWRAISAADQYRRGP